MGSLKLALRGGILKAMAGVLSPLQTHTENGLVIGSWNPERRTGPPISVQVPICSESLDPVMLAPIEGLLDLVDWSARPKSSM